MKMHELSINFKHHDINAKPYVNSLNAQNNISEQNIVD